MTPLPYLLTLFIVLNIRFEIVPLINTHNGQNSSIMCVCLVPTHCTPHACVPRVNNVDEMLSDTLHSLIIGHCYYSYVQA